MIVLNRNPPSINYPKKIKILIVEDEIIIALSLQECLESLGYEVPDIANSGEQAITKATQMSPDLVLMDIRLKGTIDGIEAAQEIWDTLQIPVIYVTGHSDKSTLERAKITAPFGYILKPVKERELYVAIETAWQRYEREQLLNSILKGMGDGVIVVNQEGRIQFINSVAEFLTGWRQNEARDRDLTEVFNIVDEETHKPLNNPVETALEQGNTIYLEDHILLISKQGTAIPIADSVAPIQDNRKEITGIVLVFRDITQRRLAEERNLAMERARYLELQMAELQRLNQLKDDFLCTVSHELRTPLSNIKMAVRLLENVLDQQGLLQEEAYSNPLSMAGYLKVLEDQCNQELALINDLLDIRAIDTETYPLELSPIQLQDWIPHVVESFFVRTQVQQQNLQIRIAGDLPALVSDLSCLTRVLSELLHNACKYTPNGGQIVVIARILEDNERAQEDREELTTSPSPSLHPSIQISVSNSGVEIPSKELPRIFDPFYRIPTIDPWQHGGTGLGLALVKKLVHRLHGQINVSSAQGWTTFAMAIPDLAGLLSERAGDSNEPQLPGY
jgi:PAS domain S-box-containing protein